MDDFQGQFQRIRLFSENNKSWITIKNPNAYSLSSSPKGEVGDKIGVRYLSFQIFINYLIEVLLFVCSRYFTSFQFFGCYERVDSVPVIFAVFFWFPKIQGKYYIELRENIISYYFCNDPETVCVPAALSLVLRSRLQEIFFPAESSPPFGVAFQGVRVFGQTPQIHDRSSMR